MDMLCPLLFHRFDRTAAAVFCLPLCFQARPDPAEIVYQPVAMRGEPAAGVEGDAVYHSFSSWRINQAGDVCFSASLRLKPYQCDRNGGAWVWDGSSARMVYQKGDPALGTPEGVRFLGRGIGVYFNDAGHYPLHRDTQGPEEKKFFGRGLC